MIVKSKKTNEGWLSEMCCCHCWALYCFYASKNGFLPAVGPPGESTIVGTRTMCFACYVGFSMRLFEFDCSYVRVTKYCKAQIYTINKYVLNAYPPFILLINASNLGLDPFYSFSRICYICQKNKRVHYHRSVAK